jgi:putative ABC transport system permease protein
MIILLKIAFQSLLNRKMTFILTIFSIAISIMLFLGIDRIRQGAKESFSNTISKTDLVVGARGSGIQLLLYTVFHMGNATNNISWSTYEHIKNDPEVKWTIPFSLGDSYNGFRVVATDHNLYEHYRFFGDKKIELAEGKIPDGVFDVALGSEMAKKENLKIGDKISLTHGISDGPGIIIHKDKPFTIVSILKETGTPLDRAAYITLEGMEAIHIDWTNGAPPIPGKEIPQNQIKKENIRIGQITAFLLGAQTRISALSLQRDINNYRKEAIMGVIPGVALSQLWETVSYAETALQIISVFVVAIGLIGMMVAIYTSLETRRREMSILRAVGAGSKTIVFLLLSESFIMSLLGCIFGYIFCYGAVIIARPFLLNEFGILIPIVSLQVYEYYYLIIVIIFSCIIGIVPAIKAYKNSLNDGLSIRI